MKSFINLGECFMERQITIDVDKLREYLIDYYGTAMFNGFPMAIEELEEVKRASDEKVVEIALKENINLLDFEIKPYVYKRY